MTCLNLRQNKRHQREINLDFDLQTSVALRDNLNQDGKIKLILNLFEEPLQLYQVYQVEVKIPSSFSNSTSVVNLKTYFTVSSSFGTGKYTDSTKSLQTYCQKLSHGTFSAKFILLHTLYSFSPYPSLYLCRDNKFSSPLIHNLEYSAWSQERLVAVLLMGQGWVIS